MRLLPLSALKWTLRDLMVAGTICTVALALGCQFYRNPERFPEIQQVSIWPQGSIEGLLTAAGGLLIYSALRFSTPHWKRTVRAFGILVGLVCLWFAAVDFTHHVGWCSRCGKFETTVSVRFYRCAVRRDRREQDNHYPSLIAADLGVPCEHTWKRELWVRAWGFAVAYPRVGGTLALSDGTYDHLRPYVLQMAKEDPGLPAIYYRRVIEQQDRQYIANFFAEVRRRKAAEASAP